LAADVDAFVRTDREVKVGGIAGVKVTWEHRRRWGGENRRIVRDVDRFGIWRGRRRRRKRAFERMHRAKRCAHRDEEDEEEGDREVGCHSVGVCDERLFCCCPLVLSLLRRIL